MRVHAWRVLSVILVTVLWMVFGAPRWSAAGQGQQPNPLIAEGVALHDRGEYDKALAKFQEALERDPNDLLALSEMAGTYYAKRDYKKAIKTAEKGLKVKGSPRGGFYMVIGNAKDDLGDTKGAAKAFQKGIESDPDNSLLHFNFGLLHLKQQDGLKARRCFQRSASLQPNHPSSHFFLGVVYAADGYRVPALMAFCRFLQLQPRSPRAPDAIRGLTMLMIQGVEPREGADGKTGLAIMLNPRAKKDEGDFMAAELSLGIAQALTLGGPAGGDRALAGRVARFISVLAGLKPGNGFASEYYVPYYAAMHAEKLSEAFAHAILQASDDPDVRAWLNGNAATVDALAAWSCTYPWTKPAVK